MLVQESCYWTWSRERLLMRRIRALLAICAGGCLLYSVSSCAVEHSRADVNRIDAVTSHISQFSDDPVPTPQQTVMTESNGKRRSSSSMTVDGPKILLSPGSVPSQKLLNEVRPWVDRAVSANGDPRTGRPAVAVISTRAEAVQFIWPGTTVDSDGPVAIVEVKGFLTDQAFDHAPGAPVRKGGDLLILLFDLSTGRADVNLLNTSSGVRVSNLALLGATASF